MPDGVVLAVVGGLITAALAVTNSALSARAGSDDTLRQRRAELYPALWALTGQLPRWPRQPMSRDALDRLHRDLRSWYFGDGGLYLSETARKRYGEFQELIGRTLAAPGAGDQTLAVTGYDHLMETASALRTALTEDLDTRNRRSWPERLRRRLQHRRLARAARTRIASAGRAGTWA